MVHNPGLIALDLGVAANHRRVGWGVWVRALSLVWLAGNWLKVGRTLAAAAGDQTEPAQLTGPLDPSRRSKSAPSSWHCALPVWWRLPGDALPPRDAVAPQRARLSAEAGTGFKRFWRLNHRGSPSDELVAPRLEPGLRGRGQFRVGGR